MSHVPQMQSVQDNPPCVALNKCVGCVGVCNILSIIEGQTDSDRMKVLIVNEECGF